MYKIEMIISTDILEHRAFINKAWKTEEGAREALRRIKEHYEFIKRMNNCNDFYQVANHLIETIEDVKNKSWYHENHKYIVLNGYMGLNEDEEYLASWIKYNILSMRVIHKIDGNYVHFKS